MPGAPGDGTIKPGTSAEGLYHGLLEKKFGVRGTLEKIQSPEELADAHTIPIKNKETGEVVGFAYSGPGRLTLKPKFTHEQQQQQIDAEQTAKERQFKLEALKTIGEMMKANREAVAMGGQPLHSEAELQQIKREFGLGSGSSSSSSQVVDVASPEDVIQLPPGTRFRTPDGRTGTRSGGLPSPQSAAEFESLPVGARFVRRMAP